MRLARRVKHNIDMIRTPVAYAAGVFFAGLVLIWQLRVSHLNHNRRNQKHSFAMQYAGLASGEKKRVLRRGRH